MSIEAMKKAQRFLRNSRECDARNDALEAVEQAIAEAEKQEQGEPVAFEHPPWTRIEDAKPVVGQPVLVFYKGFAFPDTAVWTGVGCGWARDEEFDWQWDEVVNPITHWMPLPAGPDYHCTTPQQRKPLTDEMIIAGGKALAKLHADTCGLDFDDVWKYYAEDHKADAKAAIEAAHGIKE